MLKVLEYNGKKPTNIEYNVYTPISIEFGAWNISNEPTLYWRTGDFKKSLIEIGIGKFTGDMRSITLTLSENVLLLEDNNFDVENVKLVKGIPVFEVDQFIDETYIDEKGKLDVHIGLDQVFISFSENKAVSLVQNENVSVGIDSNGMVCSIIVNDVKEHEKKILEEALK